MPYRVLADLIERHKRALAEKVIAPALQLKVIDESQIELDTQGFEYSFEIIASSIGESKPTIWSDFVQQVAINQFARGVSAQQSILLGDYMFEAIEHLIEQELSGPTHHAIRTRFGRRLASMHSLGKITAVVTQIKEQSRTPKNSLS